MPYDPTIYLGSAAHYRYGRPPCAPRLEAVLTREAGLDRSGRLLAEGGRAAEAQGIRNIRWVRGLAEDLPAVAPGPYKLVTFGQSWPGDTEVVMACKPG